MLNPSPLSIFLRPPVSRVGDRGVIRSKRLLFWVVWSVASVRRWYGEVGLCPNNSCGPPGLFPNNSLGPLVPFPNNSLGPLVLFPNNSFGPSVFLLFPNSSRGASSTSAVPKNAAFPVVGKSSLGGSDNRGSRFAEGNNSCFSSSRSS